MNIFLSIISASISLAFGFDSADYTSFTDRVVSHQNGEICVLPDIPDIGTYSYSKKDRKNDLKLCELDHYEKNAVCEKLWSSFPAVEYFKVNAKKGETKAELEKSCSRKPGQKTSLKKLAKFKYGTSCSRTSSILGYYHIARILDIKHVPNTVIRTMDKGYHLERAVAGVRKGSGSDSLITKTWAGLKSTLKKDPRDKRRGRFLLDQNGAHSYGAISKNPTGEHFYGRPFYHGAGADTGVKRFASRSEAYKDLLRSNHISAFIGDSLESKNFQRLQQMKDASELVILDTLFAQRDRIGNLHFYDAFMFTKEGKLSSQIMKDIIEDELEVLPEYLEKLEAISKKYPTKDKNSRSYKGNKKAKRLAQVELVSGYLQATYSEYAHAKRIIMKDNDCGFKGGNTWRELRLVEKIKHMSQDTYTQLMALQGFIANDPSADEYLKTELTMFDEEVKTFRSNLDYVANSLNKSCLSGQLKTDLNIKAHFRGENTDLSCGEELNDNTETSSRLTAVKTRNVRTAAVLNESSLTDASKLNGGTQNAVGDQFEVVEIHEAAGYTFYEVKVLSATSALASLVGTEETVFIASSAF